MTKLNQAQRQATEYISGPLLVLAGPGTGKTQLLSSKVAYILEHTDLSPDNILCITFTEAGAENMRQRLFNIIGKTANQLHIHTYHAFGADLLSAYRNYSPTTNRELNTPIDNVSRYKIILDLKSKLPYSDILASNSNRIPDILSAIDAVKSARLTADDLKKIAEDNLSQTTKINSKINPILKKLIPRMPLNQAVKEVYQPLLDLFKTHLKPHKICQNIEPEINFFARDLNQILEANEKLEKPKLTPLTNWKNSTFEVDQDGNYRLKNFIPNQKLLSLSNIMADYQSTLEKQGLFDFSDMIEEAIKILKADTGFRLTLTERYQYILLDEFQDTNPSQFELIRLLTNYDNPAIMAVGDDDQAIFAFQGANASNLLDFQTHYNAKVITLTENYRSTSEILNLSYHIAEQIEDSFAKKGQIAKRLISKRESDLLTTIPQNLKSSSYISRHEFISSAEEYNFVAEQTKHLIESGVKPSEIAIIAPKHKYIAPLLPYLKKYPELPLSYEKRENLLEDPKTKQLFTLAKFVHQIASGKSGFDQILEIFALPFWEIDFSQIINLSLNLDRNSTKLSSLDPFLKHPDPKIKSVAELLTKLAQASYTAPLELFINYLIGAEAPDPHQPQLKSPFLNFYAQNSDEDHLFEVYNNLLVLRENLKSYSKNTSLGLPDLIQFIEDYTIAKEAIISTSPYQESENAIQIMTAHKSKGLEFDHVFLIATDDLAWGKAKGNNTTFTFPKNLTHIRHTGATEDERLRLFFVAITRARLSLTITNARKDFSGKNPARLAYLEEYDQGDDSFSPFLPNPKITKHSSSLEKSQILNDLKTNWITSYQKDLNSNARATIQQKLTSTPLTATKITSFIDIAYAGPLSFYRNLLLPTPPLPDPKISFGNLLHATFEYITKHHTSHEAALKFINETAELLPLNPEDRIKVQNEAVIALGHILNKFQDLLYSPHARAEVNLSHEKIFINQEIPITGKIDHLQIDETNKTITIYDFKTGLFHPEKWEKHATLFKYTLQLGFYKLLLNNSPTYKNYTITEGHILFVTPDHEGKVYDKTYLFNQKDEAELINLISAIHHQLQSLNFLDDPDLKIEPDPKYNLKDIKSFIALLIDKNK